MKSWPLPLPSHGRDGLNSRLHMITTHRFGAERDRPPNAEIGGPVAVKTPPSSDGKLITGGMFYLKESAGNAELVITGSRQKSSQDETIRL